MPQLLDDFIGRNTITSILAWPKFRMYPGVHGIDAHISPLAAPHQSERFAAVSRIRSADRNFSEVHPDQQNLKLTLRNMAG
jgi:hypothetical protein